MVHIWNMKIFHSKDISNIKFCSRLRWKVKYEGNEYSYRYLDLVMEDYTDIDIVELNYDVYRAKYYSIIDVLQSKRVQESLETIKIHRCWEVQMHYKDSDGNYRRLDFIQTYNEIYELLLKCKRLKEVIWYFDIPISEERTELYGFELYNIRNPKNYDFCLVYNDDFYFDEEYDEIKHIDIHITPRKYFEVEGCLFDCGFDIENELFKNFSNNMESDYGTWLTPEHSYRTLIDIGMQYNEKLACGMEIYKISD